MSAYAYCETCDAPLPSPNIYECIMGEVKCPHGHTQVLYHAELELALKLQELWDHVFVEETLT